MRNLKKILKPQVLIDNADQWLKEFLADPSSETKKRKYKHPSIKEKLKEETSDKCIYCESKIGHITPGDIEHKKPISKFPDLTFEWENITIACGECNRRKNDYYSSFEDDCFLDPYAQDVESMIFHYGPLITAKIEHNNADITLKILGLIKRKELLTQKIQKFQDIDARYRQYYSEKNNTLKEVLKRDLIDMANSTEEYSGMVKAFLQSQGLI
jgi:uncharacterized protein (TIGR02646 family)